MSSFQPHLTLSGQYLPRSGGLYATPFPGATETFYRGALGYGPNGSGSDRILYIAPQNGYANLGFFFGVGAPDPTSLLEGSGKRMRHVKIRTVLAAQNLALVPLIQQGWAKGVKAYAQFHETRRKRHEPVAEC